MRDRDYYKRGFLRGAHACDASRGVCTTCGVIRGWLASGARAPLGWWFTSIQCRSTVHGNTASDPLRAGATVMGAQTLLRGGGGGGSRKYSLALQGAHAA